MPDQAEPLRELLRESKGALSKAHSQMRLVAVASGKGGVGKSNITLNLGLTLAQAGMRIALLDGDFGFANLDILLGMRPLHSFLDVLEGRIPLQQALTRGPYELAFISGGSEYVIDSNLRSTYGARLTQELLAIETQFDQIYIDFGAGFGSFTAELMGLCDELMIVTTPEPTALADAYALVKMVAKVIPLPPVSLLINRAHSVTEGMDASRKLHRVVQQFLHVDLQVLGYVLEDAAVRRAVSKQIPFILLEPRSMAARCVAQVAKNVTKGSLSSKSAPVSHERGVQAFIRRFLKRGG
ncbi:MinD/ParA family protein [Sulfoacidibacillus thermotolerans]|uniref:CobQ/CobB/MinD/ParA nucleotide binding domain-containing protein n=1 Tax=Sulfoacidibacillus thermotolerans TaxID=1765684 RepID=A0A2U3DA94_SULT2|nr:MinD/ParA family protein [Sulfoacidibacillus thermotolerans]PWI58204.1 hypothetical protein BM613_04535 [Sulfoacidibacillus thermotolerans]